MLQIDGSSRQIVEDLRFLMRIDTRRVSQPRRSFLPLSAHGSCVRRIKSHRNRSLNIQRECLYIPIDFSFFAQIKIDLYQEIIFCREKTDVTILHAKTEKEKKRYKGRIFRVELCLSKIFGTNELALEPCVRMSIHWCVITTPGGILRRYVRGGAPLFGALSRNETLLNGSRSMTIIIMFADRKSALYTQQYHQLGASSRSIRYLFHTVAKILLNENHFGFTLNTYYGLVCTTGLSVRKEIRKSEKYNNKQYVLLIYATCNNISGTSRFCGSKTRKEQLSAQGRLNLVLTMDARKGGRSACKYCFRPCPRDIADERIKEPGRSESASGIARATPRTST